MTEAKKLKQTIRARARKTGESYTAARRQVLSARAPHAAPTVAARGHRSPAGEEPKASPARLAMSDTAVAKKTGHGYDHWFAVLDAFGARGKGHAAAAGHLHTDHGVPGWHSQMITVAYERARGIRAVNQSCAGDFQVSVSKTIPAPVSAVVRAFSVRSQRASWLKAADAGLVRALTTALSGAKGKPVTVKDARNARLRYAWNDTKVEIRITATPKGSASVVADNTKLEGASEVAERRALWRVALDGLKAHFTA
jgi:uncharacterized protein YndB with AHSA1/START domain